MNEGMRFRSRGDVSFFTYLPCTSAGLDTSFLVFFRDSILVAEALDRPGCRPFPPPPPPAPPPPSLRSRSRCRRRRRLSAARSRPQGQPHVRGAKRAGRRSVAGQFLPGSLPAPRRRPRIPGGEASDAGPGPWSAAGRRITATATAAAAYVP